MNNELVYIIPSKGLHDLFSIVREIGAELGMYPDEIRLKDGRKISYNRKDASLLADGDISEEKYISLNKL